jgi:hypothetical protein
MALHRYPVVDGGWFNEIRHDCTDGQKWQIDDEDRTVTESKRCL